MTDPALRVIEFDELTPERRLQLWGDDPDPYEMAGDTMQWQRKRHHVGLLDQEGSLVAAAGLVRTRLAAGDGNEHAAVGLGSVIVAAPHRGRGLARRIVSEALACAAAHGPELVVLFCLRSRAGLYARLGFREIAPPVLVAQPGGPAPVSLVVMWRRLDGTVQLPPPPVRVLTLPF